MVYLPILGGLALASGTIMEKIVLRKRKIDISLYQVAAFLAVILVMLPFIYFLWQVDYSSALETKNIFVFSLVVVFSVLANLSYFYSMKWEKVNNIEPANVLHPLFVILLAIIFSFFIDGGLYERNLNVIIPSFIAAGALIFSHVRKHHLTFNRHFMAAILGSFLFASELVISRMILDYYSPFTFYFIRCVLVFFVSLLIFKPDFSRISKKVRYEILLIGIFYVLYRTIVYYGYLNLGVIFTTLLIMIAPIFIYLFAWKFLHEKLEWKNIAASIVIVLCIFYTILS